MTFNTTNKICFNSRNTIRPGIVTFADALKSSKTPFSVDPSFGLGPYIGLRCLRFQIKRYVSSINDNPFTRSLEVEHKSNTANTVIVSFDMYALVHALHRRTLDRIKEYIGSSIHGLELYIPYTVFVKVRYKEDSYFQAGSQFGWEYLDDSSLFELIEIVLDKVYNSMDKYTLVDEDIVYVQLSFREVDSNIVTEFVASKNKIVKDNLFGIEEDDYKVKTIKKDNERYYVIPSYNLPISVDGETLGVRLKIHHENDEIIYIGYVKDGMEQNFILNIREKSKHLRGNHKDKFYSFPIGFEFYYVNTSNSEYILGVRLISDGFYHKIRFSLSGIVLNNITDRLLDNNVVCRKEGNVCYYIKDGVVYKNIQDIKLIPINNVQDKSKGIDNPNIGVIDAETYLAKDNIRKVYCIGFKTNLMDKPVVYYVDSRTNINHNEIVLKLIDELLRPKYSNVNFYTHNLGGYDVVFILRVLLDYNSYHDLSERYKIESIFRENKILKVTISKTVNNEIRRLVIKDSYAILTSSLSVLAESFDVTHQKGIFPYLFSTEENLFYKGNTPSRHFYKNLSLDQYNNIWTDNWSFRDETIKYIENDLLALYEVISKANKQVFLDYNLNMIDSLTISSLAMKLFLVKYYKNNLPSINKASMYNDIKEAYYGGITEVYRPYGENLFYYDVNSLYPFVALQDLPGISCNKVHYMKGNYNLDELFGFYYCNIEADANRYLGLLPVRNKEGIHFPTGNWSGWYFSEELKFAQDNGYKISVLYGYTFDRNKDIFKEYVKDIYKIKNSPKNSVQKSMAKSLLNNLLGRFGIKLDKTITELVSREKFDSIITTKHVSNYIHIDKNKTIVSFIDKLDTNIVKSHNLDIVKLNNKYPDHEVQKMNFTSVVISAAITAYARIYMSKIKLGILNNKGKLYYSDTDSIVTDIQLDESLIGKDIGLFKLEYIINKGLFISGKTYCFIDNENRFIARAKGLKSSSLNWDDYMKLYNNIDISNAIKTTSHVDWTLGHVTIEDKYLTLYADSYTKREKIHFDKKWIDTKPLYINKTSSLNLFSTIHFIYKYMKLYIREFIILVGMYIIIVLSYIAYILSIILNEDLDNDNIPDINNTEDTSRRTTIDETSSNNTKSETSSNDTKDDLSTMNNANHINESVNNYSYETDDSTTDNNESIDVLLSLEIPKSDNDKTLYDGFLDEQDKLNRIEMVDLTPSNSRPQTSGTDASTNTLVDDFDKTTYKDTSTNTENLVDYKDQSTDTENLVECKDGYYKVVRFIDISTTKDIESPSKSADIFSPDTYKELKDEIRANQKNLDVLPVLKSSNDPTRVAAEENLLRERTYLLDQLRTHEEAVLQKASRTSTEDSTVDIDKVTADANWLKWKTEDLAAKAKKLRDKTSLHNIDETDDKDQ